MSSHRGTPGHSRAPPTLSSIILYGCASGLMGAAVMTMSQKVEQAFTHRPNSYVPARTLERLVSVRARSDAELWGLNMTMHYGQGAVAGIIRAVMAWKGIRGPFADFMFIGVRLLIDQSLENWTGVGVPPWTWPVGEQIIDILGKTVFAVATGYFVDRFVPVRAL